MQLSLSFLATDLRQLPDLGAYGNTAVEAVLFQEADLLDSPWKLAWENTEKAVRLYGNKHVTFHFPMNGSDYVKNKKVFKRLIEAYKRASDLGLNGLVVHSNRIRPAHEWSKFDVSQEQRAVLERLLDVIDKNFDKNTWLGLENMPLIGNAGYELDPLFCLAKDFLILPDRLSVVWDICHATSSIEYVKKIKSSENLKGLNMRHASKEDFDFTLIYMKVRHWHFASFKNLNIPRERSSLIDGLLPSEGMLRPLIYENLLKQIARYSDKDSTVNFEVQETDYVQRRRGPEIIDWAKYILDI